jgi:hypothetical protein
VGEHPLTVGDRLGAADAGPVGDAVERHAQRLLAAGGHRVVEAHALDEAAVAALARVGDDDVVERALLGAATGQSDHDHGVGS